jgi:TRAP-type mannitol/chloroaromatic compound transport system permease small subunit
MSPANVPIFQFKMIIVAAGVLLFIQGWAQVFRCILCIRTGKWPEHAEDVEELETILMMEHGRGVDPPPGATLDEGVRPQ